MAYLSYMLADRRKFKLEWVQPECFDTHLTLSRIWRFPGIGAFQCYDKYMLGGLKVATEDHGKPEWGCTGPTDASEYNNWPEDTNFFKREYGGWNSEYGEFFLSWYSQILLDRGDRILSSISIFENQGVKISVKVAGIHWHYRTRSHAPELTAGYYNTRY